MPASVTVADTPLRSGTKSASQFPRAAPLPADLSRRLVGTRRSVMTEQTPKWTKTRRHPGRIPGYRREKPYRFDDWAAL